MSKQRMRELQFALQDAGWVVSRADCDDFGELFETATEVVVWNIRNEFNNAHMELEFHLFDDLGKRTNRLSDILYCVARGCGFKLYFSKAGKDEWTKRVTVFIDEIGNGAK